MNSTYAQKSSTVQKAANRNAASVLDSSSQRSSLQRKADMANSAVQREERPNNTGMPDNLKSGIESLSGFSMDDVRVHYNSSKPATVQALAYTQGTDIHVAPGQEKCLPHEAWHVAQQMAGRVSPTTNINGMPVNDNAALEHEADVMGEKAVQCKKNMSLKMCYNKNANAGSNFSMQRVPQDVNLENIDDKCAFLAGLILENNTDLMKSYDELQKRKEIFSQDNGKLDKIKWCEKQVILLQHCFWASTVFKWIVQKKHRSLETCCCFVMNFCSQITKFDASLIFAFVNSYWCMLDDRDKQYVFNIVNRPCLTAIDKAVEYCQSHNGNVSFEDSLKCCFPENLEKIEDKVEFAFDEGLRILSSIAQTIKKGSKLDDSELQTFLVDKMILYKCNQDSGTIYDFVKYQLDVYKDSPTRQLSVMILGVARKISYILNDPWAENRIARLISGKLKDQITQNENNLSLNEVSAFARSNPILMYVNSELNEQDACHLIRIRSIKYFGEDKQERYNEMFNELRKNALVVLSSMKECGAMLDLRDNLGFSPASLGMFRLYGNKEKFGEKFDESIKKLKDFKIENDRGFIKYNSDVWKENAKKNDDAEKTKKLQNSVQDKDYIEFIGKLVIAPITIRLYSSDLIYQKNGFYHAYPWFSSVELGGVKVPYHPYKGRDNKSHYSLWRTFKDHFYRGMLWKRGMDGISENGNDSQSIDNGKAIQQSFGALNFNFEKNCYGLMSSQYGYGNVSLVLKDSVKENCIYTIGDKGRPFSNIYSVAHALAYGEDTDIAGYGNIYMKRIRNMLKGGSGYDESLEAQIFQDIKFGPSGDVKKIVCVGVSDKEYIQLLQMAGANVQLDENGNLIDNPEYKKFVERY